MSNLKAALTRFLWEPKAGSAMVRQSPKLGSATIQLLNVPKPWDWPVPSTGGSISSKQFELCDHLPQDCDADTYIMGGQSYSSNYKLFIDVLSDQFKPENLLTEAKEVLLNPDEDKKHTGAFKQGWIKVPDTEGIDQWQPEWKVEMTPFDWRSNLSSTSEDRPFRIPITDTPIELFFDTDTNNTLEIPSDDLEHLEFIADAFGQIDISPGDWYLSSIVQAAKMGDGPFNGSFTYSKFFGPSGPLSCRISGLIVALNPAVRLISKKNNELANANALQNLQSVKLGESILQEVKPSVDESNNLIELTMGKSPDVPLIIGVVLEKSYKEQPAHSLSLFKKSNVMMNVIALIHAHKIIEAALSRFLERNNSIGDETVDRIQIIYDGIKTVRGQRLWNCGPPQLFFGLHEDDVEALRVWWENYLPASGSPKVLPLRPGSDVINIQYRKNGILFNFHLAIFQPARHSLMQTTPKNDIQVKSEGKVSICAKGKYRIGISNGPTYSTNGREKLTAKIDSQKAIEEEQTKDTAPIKPMKAYPENLLQKIIHKNKKQTSDVNTHAHGFGLVVEEIKVWKEDVLKISFKGGTPDLHRKIASAANEWTKYGNINFDFGEDLATGTFRSWTPGDTSHIRIGFAEPGYWSLVGNDSVDLEVAAPGDITMNFQDFNVALPEDWSGTVIHEFGHALGFHHEHQSPDAGCDFDWPKIYQVLAGAPNFWSEEIVDRNLRELHEHNGLFTSQHDPKSIMHYHFDAWMFKSGASSPCYTPKNLELSETDKEMMGKAYPFDEEEMTKKNEVRIKGLKNILEEASLTKKERNQYKELCKYYEESKHMAHQH